MDYLPYIRTTIIKFYNIYIRIDLAHNELYCAKVGKSGIRNVMFTQLLMYNKKRDADRFCEAVQACIRMCPC